MTEKEYKNKLWELKNQIADRTEYKNAMYRNHKRSVYHIHWLKEQKEKLKKDWEKGEKK